MNRDDCLTGITLYKGNSSEAVVLAAYIKILETKNSQGKKIRWAQDFTWEKHIRQLKAERRLSNKLRDENGTH